MARRKAAKRRRRPNASFKLLPLAEAYLQFNVLTQGAANVSPVQFFVGKAGGTYNPATSSNPFLAYGPNSVSLKELITRWNTPHGGSAGSKTESQIVWDNLKENWWMMGIQSIGIGAGFKIGKKLLRKPISQANRLLKMAGVASVVKI